MIIRKHASWEKGCNPLSGFAGLDLSKGSPSTTRKRSEDERQVFHWMTAVSMRIIHQSEGDLDKSTTGRHPSPSPASQIVASQAWLPEVGRRIDEVFGFWALSKEG